jgi:hypothetical protein
VVRLAIGRKMGLVAVTLSCAGQGGHGKCDLTSYGGIIWIGMGIWLSIGRTLGYVHLGIHEKKYWGADDWASY